MGYSQRRRIGEQPFYEALLMLTLLGVALLQTALLPRPLGLAPNVLLLLVVCHTLIAGPARSSRWALYAGVALDLCAATPLGSHVLALLAGALITLTLRWLSRGNWLLPLLGAVLGTMAYHASLALITTVLVAPVDLRAYVLVAVVPDALILLVAALPTYMLMRWVAGWRRGEVPVDVY
ncbi:MAG: hypothetical protein RLZZ387_3877 [Chloroflexota bacterium]|jgi:rod shape-determining protein MreD